MSDTHKVRLTIEPDREIEVTGRELRNLRRQGLVIDAPHQPPAVSVPPPVVAALPDPTEETPNPAEETPAGPIDVTPKPPKPTPPRRRPAEKEA